MTLYPYYLTSFPIKQLENDTSDQPLDLSLRTLEKIVLQQFKDQAPIQQISKKLNLSIDKIYSIISKKYLIKIKEFKKYTPDIKYRIKEAQNKGKTPLEIAEIFNLNPQQVVYINNLNRDIPTEQLYHSANLIRNKGASPKTIERLKALLYLRRIQYNLKERHEKKYRI